MFSNTITVVALTCLLATTLHAERSTSPGHSQPLASGGMNPSALDAIAPRLPHPSSTTILVTTTKSEAVTNGECSIFEALDNMNFREAVSYNNMPNPHPDCPAGAEYVKIDLPAGKYDMQMPDCGPESCLKSTGGRLEIQTSMLIEGKGPVNTILDFGGHQNTLEVTRLADAVIAGLTIQNVARTAISNAAHLELDNVLLQDNGIAPGLGYSNGGAIANLGDLHLSNSVIRRNRTQGRGGGIHNEGNLWTTNSTLSGNAGIEGGGLFNKGHATIESVTFSQNSANVWEGSAARRGGAIFNDSNSLVILENVTMSGNLAIDSGGGVFSRGNALFRNVTVAGNEAGKAAGIHADAGQAELWNVLLASNRGGNCDGDGMLVQLGNLSSDGSCAGKFTGTENFNNVDPKIGPLADNGGPTRTHALQYGSPAVDRGSNYKCSTHDQRGDARPQDGDSDGKDVCDIGAFELKSGSFVIVPELVPLP